MGLRRGTCSFEKVGGCVSVRLIVWEVMRVGHRFISSSYTPDVEKTIALGWQVERL